MAVCCFYSHPDLFIMATTNPQWMEIVYELFPHQSPSDCTDLVACVFHLKLKSIMDNIIKNKVFGPCAAYIFAIKFQKHGLPHSHILIFLKHGWELLSLMVIDSVISAHWPDPNTKPFLFDTIRQSMVHGPCGPINPHTPCMENGQYTKSYPKPF